jgi:hypothetical protein
MVEKGQKDPVRFYNQRIPLFEKSCKGFRNEPGSEKISISVTEFLSPERITASWTGFSEMRVKEV